MQVIPAINAIDLEDAKSKAAVIKSFLSKGQFIHIDVSDGRFSPVKSWGEADELSLLNISDYKIEIHLMVKDVLVEMKKWLAVAARIIIHIEELNAVDRVLNLLKKRPVELMLAIKPSSSLEILAPYFDQVDAFQVLAVEAGYSGRLFQEEILDRIELLRDRLPSATIEVDGGITLSVAQEIKRAGADTVVSASYILNHAKPEEAFKQLQEV